MRRRWTTRACSLRDDPIAGRTGSIQVHAGNMLRPNDERTLVTINQIRPIAVTFTVPESALDAIRRAQSESKLKVVARAARGGAELAASGARGSAPSGTAGGNEAPDTGVLSFVDNTIDRATGTVRLKATFANTSGLVAGTFRGRRLTLAHDPNALVVGRGPPDRPAGLLPFVVSRLHGGSRP
jgi:multidrug efflux system membrane fusion protein